MKVDPYTDTAPTAFEQILHVTQYTGTCRSICISSHSSSPRHTETTKHCPCVASHVKSTRTESQSTKQSLSNKLTSAVKKSWSEQSPAYRETQANTIDITRAHVDAAVDCQRKKLQEFQARLPSLVATHPTSAKWLPPHNGQSRFSLSFRIPLRYVRLTLQSCTITCVGLTGN